MSDTIPVNWSGCKIVSASNLALIDNKRTSQPATTFPNGKLCPAGTTIDRYGRFRVRSLGSNMQADGEALSALYTPLSFVQALLRNEQGKTPLELDNSVKKYNEFIRKYVPGTDDATAQTWVAQAIAVDNNGWNGASALLDHVKADAVQIKKPLYNTSMHQF